MADKQCQKCSEWKAGKRSGGMSKAALQRAYEAGKACARDGPNTTNCHFSLFATRAMTTAWEHGKADGDKQKVSR